MENTGSRRRSLLRSKRGHRQAHQLEGAEDVHVAELEETQDQGHAEDEPPEPVLCAGPCVDSQRQLSGDEDAGEGQDAIPRRDVPKAGTEYRRLLADEDTAAVLQPTGNRGQGSGRRQKEQARAGDDAQSQREKRSAPRNRRRGFRAPVPDPQRDCHREPEQKKPERLKQAGAGPIDSEPGQRFRFQRVLDDPGRGAHEPR